MNFTVPLTPSFHQVAEKFRQQQLNPAKGEQVYRNTLAVLAVNFYCKCMGIPTNLEASDSWNPVLQSLADVADLELESLGKIECRPALAQSEWVEITQSVWENRIGYIIVEISASMKEAKLLGFTSRIATEELTIGELKSLENFLECVHQLRENKPIHLSEWLRGICDRGWESVERILTPQTMELVWNVRDGKSSVKRGKMVDVTRGGDRVALVVGMKPTSTSEMDIWLEVYPTPEQSHLPPDLQVMVLDDDGVAVMQACARSTKNIQLNFSGEPGERFGIKIVLGNTSITEAFII